MNSQHSKIIYNSNHHQLINKNESNHLTTSNNNKIQKDEKIDEVSFNYNKDQLQGLILKNQQLQELLQESQDSLRLVSIEKSTIYHENQKLANLLKQRNHALDYNKEEIWNLELAKQDLSRQLRELELKLKKVLKDQSRWLQQEYHLKQELDYYKQQHLEWKESMTIAKKEKLELIITKKKLKSLQQQQSSTSISYLDNDSIITTAATTSSSSISSSSSLPSLSSIYHLTNSSYHHHPFFHLMVTLQSNLGNAQKMIHKLKYDLEFEKNKRLELESFWRDTQDFIENRNIMMMNHHNNNACIKTKKEITTFPSSSSSLSLSHEDEYHETSSVENNYHTIKSLGDELSLALQKQQVNNDNFIESYNNNISLSSSQKEKEKKKEKSINHIEEKEDEKENNLELDQQSTKSISSLPPSPPVELISYQQQQQQQHQENIDDSDSDSDDNIYQDNFDHSNLINKNNKELKNEDIYGSALTTESFIYSSQKLLHNNDNDNNNYKRDNENQHHDLNQFKQKYNNINNNNSNNNKSMTINNTSFLLPTSLTTSSYYHRRIKALSHTMIGERLWKYINNNKNRKRHERYFWLHPYSKTVYWSIDNPGMNEYQQNTKSDETNYIIELKTMNRRLQIQCPNETSYQSWFTTFHYLIGNESFSTSLIQHQNHLSKLLMHFPPSVSTTIHHLPSSNQIINSSLNIYKNGYHQDHPLLSTSSIVYENNIEENDHQENGLYSNTILSSLHHSSNEMDQSSFKDKRKKSYLFIPSNLLTKLLHFKNKKKKKSLIHE